MCNYNIGSYADDDKTLYDSYYCNNNGVIKCVIINIGCDINIFNNTKQIT